MAYDDLVDSATAPLVPDRYPFPQTSITGIGRIQTPESLGIWDGSDVSGVGFVPGSAGTKKVLSGAGKRIGGALENLTTDPYLAPDEAKNQPPAPEVSPAVDDQARTSGAVPDILAKGQPPTGSLADKLVRTTKEKSVGGRVLNGPYDEARSGSAPGASSEPTAGGGAAPPPTEPNPQGPTGLPGMLGKLFNSLGDWRDQNRMTLMALAGGLAGSQSIGQGVGRGFTAVANAMPAQNALNNQNATMKFFMSPQGGSMSPDMARALSANPQLVQEALGQVTGLTPPKTISTQGIIPHTAQWVPGKGWQEVQISGSGNSGTNNISDAQWNAMTPDQREAALPAEERNIVHMIRTGATNISPRAWAMGTELMGKVDPSWTPNLFHAQQTMATDLEKATPNTQGGLLLNGLSTYGHLAETARSMADVGGYSGPDMPGGNLIGEAYTYGRNKLADPDLASKLTKEKQAATRSGEEGTKFYTATGGSTGEREAMANTVSGGTATPAQKVGYLRAESGLMQHRINDLLMKVMSNPAGKEYFNRPENAQRLAEMQNNVREINHAIAQMDPGGPEAAAEKAQNSQGAAPAQQQMQPPTPGRPPQIRNDQDRAQLPSGTMYFDPLGNVRRKP